MFLILVQLASATLLTIKSPPITTTYQNNTIPVNVADFGYVPYGRKVIGELYHQSKTCVPINQTLNSSIIISEDAGCTFLAQAMNTQIAGGKMLIIIYNGEQDIQNFLLIADHSSSQVFIPTIMISKADGQFLLDKLIELSQITVSIEFSLNQQEIVSLDYHMSSLDNQSYMFLTQFKPFAQQMGDQLIIQPTYVSYQCQPCREQNFTVLREDCISGGRYCSFDPDKKGPLTGRDVIMENLNELCIYNEYGQQYWLNYVTSFALLCNKDIKICAQKVMELTQIDPVVVLECVNQSFTGNNFLFDENTLLKEQYSKILRSSQYYWPILFINQQLYDGDLFIINLDEGEMFTVDDFAVLEAICDGFIDQTRPEFCNSTGYFTINGEQEIEQYSKISIILLVVVTIFLLILIFILFILYRRKLLKKMNEDLDNQVENQLKQYYKINETK